VSYDSVVVGAGLAGMTAAVRIAESGLRCVAVAKGVGSLYLGGATIDFLGYSDGPVENPGAELASFCSARPGHPYTRLSIAQMQASVDWLKAAAGGYHGDLSANMLIPTALGVPKPTAVAPESVAGGDMRSGGNVVLVGFGAMKDFYPMLAADNLQRSMPGVSARGVELALSPVDEPDVSPVRFGRAFDDVEFRKRVIAQVEGRLDGADRVGFPAVLGVRDATTAWMELRDALGVGVFEIPTLPPSIPGMRLFEKLKARLHAAGGRIILNNTVQGVRASGTTVTELEVDNGTRTVTLPTKSVVLATGGVAAGGIAMNSSWEVIEPALGLPVAGVPPSTEARFDPDFFADHPIGAAGVATDGSLRPLDAAGEVIYENVFVAGATLSGGRPWREGSGNGISLATGWAAAANVIEGVRSWS
jgi:glycerol-3-phosphate dehydrogenase subunit B